MQGSRLSVTRMPVRRWLAVLTTAALVAVGLVTALQPAESAQALSGSDFHAGYIITDHAFYNANAMTASQIQAFLAAKEGSCTGTCLAKYTVATPDHAAGSADSGALICGAYAGSPSELASSVIFKAQKACGISAKAILATLQKESGLVTAKAATAKQLDEAMGYNCPGECNPVSRGFFKQVFGAAWQLKLYKLAQPGDFAYRLGTYDIPYSSAAGCASPALKLWNYATAALYNYTPFQPNAAALKNLSGSGDACSSLGNRNFWVIYNGWFGSPTTLGQAGVSLSRLQGADRFATAVAISRSGFPATAPVVYVTTGLNYPDALSAAPAAAKQGGPLLLVRPTSLPSAVKNEIARLKPALIVVAGGPGAVSNGVYRALEKLAPKIRRDAGADRYETSRIVIARAFTGSALAYVATGANFPDALSASAAAAASAAPVVLVNGSKTTLDTATRKLLATLKTTRVKIAGGPAVVSKGIASVLSETTGITSVRRLYGADRYQTAERINRDAFSASSTLYLANGQAYPDALAGAAVAGVQKAPLYVIPPRCAPFDILEDAISLGASRVVLLGGTGALASSVTRAPCSDE